jgi:hypothetical protein
LKTKTILMIGFFVLGVAVIVGQALYKSYLGDGQAVVFAPPDRAVDVSLDGGQSATIPAGEFRRYTASQGDHKLQVVLDGQTSERPFMIKSGHSHMGVPVLDEQCYVALDVATSHYKFSGASDADKPLPYLHRRYREQGAFNLPKPFYFREDHLPKSKRAGAGVYLFYTVPCQVIEWDANKLVRAMGYKGVDVTYPDKPAS